jgi:hypothetical protein
MADVHSLVTILMRYKGMVKTRRIDPPHPQRNPPEGTHLEQTHDLAGTFAQLRLYVEEHGFIF